MWSGRSQPGSHGMMGGLRVFSVIVVGSALGCGGEAPTPVSKQDQSATLSRTQTDRDGNDTRIELPPQTNEKLLERTPENDPNVTRTGPKLGVARRLTTGNASCERFSPTCRFVVYHDPPKLVAVSLEQPDQPPRELSRLPFTPLDLRIVNDDLDLLVLEAEPEQPGRFSSADP